MKTLTQNIALTIVLNLSLFANTDQSNTKTQEYLNKLPKYKGNLEVSPETIMEKAGDLSIQSLREKIQNTDLSKFGDMELLEPDKEYLKNAQEIKDFTVERINEFLHHIYESMHADIELEIANKDWVI